MEYTYVIIGVITILIIGFFIYYKTQEHLSLSQWPDPSCAGCQSCTFYSTGCGTLFQLPNKEDSYPCPTANGGFVDYNVNLCPGCPESPKDENFDLIKTENSWGVQALEIDDERVGITYENDPQRCKPTYNIPESGSTGFDEFGRSLPCPLPFPPVTPEYQVVAESTIGMTNMQDFKSLLDSGALIISAQDNKTIEKLFNELVKQYIENGRAGYADFYYIEGPILVMVKVGQYYYYMVDHPIKYTPYTMPNYVNRTSNWNIAQTVLTMGIKLLNPNSPVFAFATSEKCKPIGVKCKDPPLGYPGGCSTPDGDGPGCKDGLSCLWGPKYGSGNWTLRV